MSLVWRRARLVIALAVALSAASCSHPLNQGAGQSRRVSQPQAVALATQHTPLATVIDTLPTPPGPVMWFLLGADQGGRPMAVWVRSKVEGQLYLDEGTSREDAVETARGLAEQMGYTVISPQAVLVNPMKPTWWVPVKIEEQYWGQIFVDFGTGEAQANPNDPWDKSKAKLP